MKEVELKGVQFGYDPKKIVLEKIDLAIPNKDLVAVIGPNGEGKSTLFRLILRLLKPLQGGCSSKDNILKCARISLDMFLRIPNRTIIFLQGG